MATCPRCGRFLTDDHRCLGAWRHVARYACVSAIGAVIGGLGAFVGFEHPAEPVVAVVALLGAVLAPAIWRSLH